MNLYRLLCFTYHWSEYPPLHVAFAGFLQGLSGKPKSKTPATTPDARGFPDRPEGGTKQNPSYTEHMPDLPAEMKDSKGYDAPDPKSPVFRGMMSKAGAEIHIIKSKSPTLKK